MLKQFENLRNEIRHYAAKENDYKKAIELCFEYLREVNKLSNYNAKSDNKWIYYEVALNCKKLGDINSAIKYALISLNYLDSSDYEGTKYINRLWLLASLHTEVGNITEAKRLYYQCSGLFRKIQEENQRAMIIFNNAKLMKNFKTMLNIIKIYESKVLKTTIATYGDMEYDDVLKSMYQELTELYILESKRQEAFRIIYGVKDKKFRKELSAKLVA